MATRAIVLLSAGLDSCVNFKKALDAVGVSAALTFDYGQRAARREKNYAAAICARFRVRHEVISLPWLAAITRTALVDRRLPIPAPIERNLDRLSLARRTAARVWVPNRNGVFVAVAAAFAEAVKASLVVAGFNAEEAATFPDNSPEFVAAQNSLLRLSTLSGVRVKAYTATMRKRRIMRLGRRIGAPLDLIWCCYEGGKRMCGECESCRRFARAARQAGMAKWFAANHAGAPANLLQEARP